MEAGAGVACLFLGTAGVVGLMWLFVKMTANQPPSAPQLIVSQYRGNCPACLRVILPGMNIWWVRGQKARHQDCAIARAAEEEGWLAEALDKLRDARGPASRANVLTAALGKITEQPRREKLLIEAARIGVQATLDKVDTLKGVRAKRRLLEEALVTLRADPVPDELQVEEVAWLSDALKQLDES